MNGLAGVAVPNDNSLALISDTDGDNVGGNLAGVLQSVSRRGQAGCPKVAGIVFDPARFRKMLGKLLCRGGQGPGVIIEYDRPA